MRKALYIEGVEKTIILANCITKSQYEKIYKGNLFCPIDGCNAKLGFREVKKQRDGKYFYTLPRNKHAEGCPNRIMRKRKRLRRINIRNYNTTKSDFSQLSFKDL